MPSNNRNRSSESAAISKTKKGKEKLKESSGPVKMAEERWPRTVHGAGYCDGSCRPGPSCMLFPRRPDGKVILPDPRDSSKSLFRAKSFSGRPTQILPSGLTPQQPDVNRKSKSRAHNNGLIAIEPRPSTSGSLPVENYAQLSSLPEFKAFRMDHKVDDREPKPLHQPNQGPLDAQTLEDGDVPKGKDVDKDPDAKKSVDAEWQQWKMREIRVVRRKRKQEYIRSGTHDFSIRLWSNYEA